MVAGLETVTRRHRRDRRTHRQRHRAEGPRHRDGVPELRALSAHERLRQHGLWPADAAHEPRPRSAAGSAAAAEILQLDGLLAAQAAPALGRAAPARRDGPRHRARPARCSCSTSRLSNLDAKLRVQMRVEIKRLQQRARRRPSIYVTHDQVEAMTSGRPADRHECAAVSIRSAAARSLRAPGHRLCRRLHRLAGDEPRRRPRRWDGGAHDRTM